MTHALTVPGEARDPRMRSRPPEYRGGTSCRSRSVVLRLPSGRRGTPRRSGTAHRHCRAHRRGHAAIDRERHVPRSWITGAGRRRSAGIPEEVGFATKPALALRMIDRTPDTGIRAARVAADGVCQGDPQLPSAGISQVGYVLAVARDHRIATLAGRARADAPAERLPEGALRKPSADADAGRQKGIAYDRVLAGVADDQPGHRRLLVRRNRDSGELAFCHCCPAAPVSLRRPAGRVGLPGSVTAS
ncbi:transposase [Streptomyces sp. NPDC048279]|uniref:transposase n=1 Tax=Streptomyces sp. NPDC048279 TaxID=3154714 RepID=UPI00342DAE28